MPFCSAASVRWAIGLACVAAAVVAPRGISGASTSAPARHQVLQQPADAPPVWLPLIAQPASPSGSYNCNEYEFGAVWTTEVITLNTDLTSVYVYTPPYGGVVTGTWSYNMATQRVQLRNFRWPIVTFEPPNQLQAQGDTDDIKIACQRRSS